MKIYTPKGDLKDVVSIKTSKDSFPERSWYSIITTSKARGSLNRFDWKDIEYINWKARKEAEKINNIALTEERISDLQKSLGSMHTKQLLALLAKYRVCITDDSYWNWDVNDLDSILSYRDRVFDLIKTELATREHVMNKIEAKKARQKAAKQRNTRNCRAFRR
ncbi:MAG: hypothetical protein ABIB11_01980 [Candidatus Omnitrophota bacterium]